MPPVYCCVNDCWKSLESKHRFPDPSKNKPLFDKWVNLCGNKRLILEMTPTRIYSNCRVCGLHFLPKDFGPNRTLKKGVVPSVNLPDPLKAFQEIANPIREVTIVASDDAMPSTSSQSPSIILSDSEQDELNIKSSNANKEDNVTASSTRKLPATPKRRSNLLSEVNVAEVKDLTPKAKHLYERAMQFKRRAITSTRTKLSLKRRLLHAQKFTTSQMFDKVVSSMDRIRARFFQSQIENVNKKPKGRRYSLEDKVLALALYKQSGAGYRFLSKLFSLPSRKTVMKLLNRIPIKPGLHNEVFTVLKAEVKNFKNPLDKHCLLMFDEISIQPNLQPNLKEGTVEGFEDFGFRKSEQIANHAQVFMLRGIRRKWKQPVYYNFVNGGTKTTDLVLIIKQILRKCHSIGLNILATVCDQGANNQSAINTLIKQTEEKYARKGIEHVQNHFEVDDQKIIPLFDVPHLFKGIRNNLLKYHLHFMDNGSGKLAKWSDIFTAYKIDPYLGSLRLMPKLTDSHVNPEKINKMKVSKCTQVFSHSVAAAINVFAFTGTTVEDEGEVVSLDKTAADTATLVDFLDQLFDSLNGSSFSPVGGKLLRVGVTKGSPHVHFWDQALEKLKCFRYIKKGSYFIPPSLKNLIKTIQNFKTLWKTMLYLGFTYLMPRTFNQDPLENFFGKIRQRGHRNINPTPTDFNHYYKSLLVNHLTSSQSVGANCEDDKSEVFLTLQRLVSQGLPEEDEGLFPEKYSIVPENLPVSIKPIEVKVLKYVAGYVVKKIGRQPCECRDLFLKREQPEDFKDDEFLKYKEFRVSSMSLKYVSAPFLQKMKYALAIVKYIFNRDLHKKDIVSYTLKTLCKMVSLTPCFHDNLIKTNIFNYFIKVNLFNYCGQLNKIIKGLDQRTVPKNAPRIFLMAKKLNYNTLKRRRAQNKNRFACP